MLQTPFHDWHAAHGGRMVDFAGWRMPVQYTTIIDEHHAVRRAAGLFDIAHMGRLRFTGPQAAQFVDRLVTIDVTTLKPRRIRYALVCNEQGGILDDVLVYGRDDGYLMVVNASNRLKLIDWFRAQQNEFEATLEDLTTERAMLALQGPRAVEVLNPLADADIAAMKYYTGCETTVDGTPALVSRTGYTGEDGFEIIVAAEAGPALWQTLIDRGRAQGVTACGLGCRDTLRLEAAMPLYGHELDETLDPFTAGLSFAVKLDAGDFVGKQALVEIKDIPDRPQRVGLELSGRRIAREGAELCCGHESVGRVTSGTFSPTLEKSIAMGYIARRHADAGSQIEVDIRGKRESAVVVDLPFYRRG